MSEREETVDEIVEDWTREQFEDPWEMTLDTKDDGGFDYFAGLVLAAAMKMQREEVKSEFTDEDYRKLGRIISERYDFKIPLEYGDGMFDLQEKVRGDYTELAAALDPEDNETGTCYQEARG